MPSITRFKRRCKVSLILEALRPMSDLCKPFQAIENNAGRVRKDNRWGPRILDLDIILFGFYFLIINIKKLKLELKLLFN